MSTEHTEDTMNRENGMSEDEVQSAQQEQPAEKQKGGDVPLDDITATQETPQLSMEGRDIQVGRILDLTEKETVPGTDCRIFYPEGEGPFPVLYFIHGGAFVGGFNFMDEPVCRQMCRDAGCAVISPNYPLAPDHKWPAGLNALYDLLLFFKDHAAQYDLDMEKLAVGGDSAGGNLAAALCVKTWQTKAVRIGYQALVYPDVDLVIGDVEHNWRVNRFTDTVAMNPAMLPGVNQMYLPDGADPADPLISPAHAPAEAFPPTSVFTGQKDIFWQEGRNFAAKLSAAGVPVLYRSYANVGHGFMEIKGREDISRNVKRLMAAELVSFFSGDMKLQEWQ